MESEQTKPGRDKRVSFLILLFLLFGMRMSSCSAPEYLPHNRVVEMPTESLQQGRLLFNNYCASCHPGGMSGLGPAIINKPLPKSIIEFQIRNGIGVMPAFDEEVLDDRQVEDIAEYLVYLRKGKKLN